MRFTNADGNILGEIGGCGNVDSGLGYCYLSAGGYNSEKSLRLYANGDVNIGSTSSRVTINGAVLIKGAAKNSPLKISSSLDSA